VARRHPIQLPGTQFRKEKVLADPPCGLFQVVPRVSGDLSDVRSLLLEFQAQLRGRIPDEPGVAIGIFAAEHMIDVKDLQPQVPTWCELAEQMEHGHRISASRYGDANAVPGSKHPVALDGAEHALFEVGHDNFIVGPDLNH